MAWMFFKVSKHVWYSSWNIWMRHSWLVCITWVIALIWQSKLFPSLALWEKLKMCCKTGVHIFHIIQKELRRSLNWPTSWKQKVSEFWKTSKSTRFQCYSKIIKFYLNIGWGPGFEDAVGCWHCWSSCPQFGIALWLEDNAWALLCHALGWGVE